MGELVKELSPLRKNAFENHPWRERADAASSEVQRMPGGQSRWSAGKDLSWEPLRIERQTAGRSVSRGAGQSWAQWRAAA